MRSEASFEAKMVATCEGSLFFHITVIWYSEAYRRKNMYVQFCKGVTFHEIAKLRKGDIRIENKRIVAQK